ncbi:hypothetical protein O5541_06620 [Escherichia coli]|nr:hypothetical protein [Escherichia coli]
MSGRCLRNQRLLIASFVAKEFCKILFCNSTRSTWRSLPANVWIWQERAGHELTAVCHQVEDAFSMKVAGATLMKYRSSTSMRKSAVLSGAYGMAAYVSSIGGY